MNLYNNVINRAPTNTILVSSATALDTTALYQDVLCTAPADYTVTFPPANLYGPSSLYKGASITLIVASGEGIVTCDIGALDFNPKLGAAESIIVKSDGTSWVIVNQNLVPVNFIATPDADQELVNAVPEQIAFADVFISNCGFAGNYFETLYPGRYEFWAAVELTGINVTPTTFEVDLCVVNDANPTGISVYSSRVKSNTNGDFCRIAIPPFAYKMNEGDLMYLQAEITAIANQSIDGTSVPVPTFFAGRRITNLSV